VKVLHVDEAAMNLKAIIRDALNGEDTYIYLDNPERRIRLLAGTAGRLFWMSDDFDAPLSDFKEYMYDELIIRPYEEKDSAAVIKLLAELQNYERTFDKYLKGADEKLIGSYLNQLIARCQANRGMICVAERDQTVVGMMSMYHEHHDEILMAGNDYLYISDLVVTAEYRRQNIATYLMKRAEEYARLIKMPLIKLHVIAQNEAAIGAYRKSGFHMDGVEMIKSLDESI